MAQTVVVAGVFLVVAGFLASWDGRAVGVLTPRGEEPRIYEVVIVEADGTVHQRTMPSYAVLQMGLPVLATGVPPDPVPETALHTRKSRFQLNYLVETRPEGAQATTWVSLPTTTPQAVGMAMVLWFLGLAIRNMAYAGSPFWIERQREFFLPKAQAQSGSAATASASSRGRKAPPPPKSRRGPRR